MKSPNPERNSEIYRLSQEGARKADLARQYNVTRMRIVQIVEDEQNRNLRATEHEKRKLLQDDACMQQLRERFTRERIAQQYALAIASQIVKQLGSSDHGARMLS